MLGAAIVAVLVSLLSDELFAVVQGALVAASGALLLALAFAVFLRPVRRALGATFAYPVPPPGGPALSVAQDAELRDLMQPLLVALVLLGVAGAATLLR